MVGLKEPGTIPPPSFPKDFPAKKQEIHRRASAGAQAECIAETHSNKMQWLSLLQSGLSTGALWSSMVTRCLLHFPRCQCQCGADFPAAIFIAGKCPNLGRIACRAAGKSEKTFPAASTLNRRKNLQKGISDSHSLLEFSDN